MSIKNRKLNRLPDYDYTTPGAYYVTVCTDNREDYLGKIVDGKLVLNQYGEIVESQWKWLAHQYSYVDLDEFVVMPNHFHGVLIIVENGRGDFCRVGNGRDHSLPIDHPQRIKIKSLSQLIGAFKTTSSKLIHKAGCAEFCWQTSFHDHIIRDDFDLDRVRQYIRGNLRINP